MFGKFLTFFLTQLLVKTSLQTSSFYIATGFHTPKSLEPRHFKHYYRLAYRPLPPTLSSPRPTTTPLLFLFDWSHPLKSPPNLGGKCLELHLSPTPKRSTSPLKMSNTTTTTALANPSTQE